MGSFLNPARRPFPRAAGAVPRRAFRLPFASPPCSVIPRGAKNLLWGGMGALTNYKNKSPDGASQAEDFYGKKKLKNNP